MKQMMKILNWPFMILIKAYRYFISPLLGPRCRFTPTCSEYGLQAFKKYPIHIALYKTIWRILRCHPFSAGGHDPVE